MGDKISTIVLKVDLECQRCYKKIRRVLCKIQDKMNIKTISFDEKSNSVTVSGPFDAEKVCQKLCCHAGSVIKEMNIKGKESKDGGGDKAAAKQAGKDAGKPEKGKEGKADKEGKAEKDGKADKEAKPAAQKKDAKPAAEKKEAKGETEAKPDKEKPKDDAKPAKAVPKADIGPLLDKIMAAKAAGPEPPRGEPIAPPVVPAAQGVAVPSIWPAPASSLAGYSYNPSYDPSYYGGGYGCGCGYAGGYCRCGKPAAPGGGYYGLPVYDNQGWYYGGRQPYYPQQQQQQPCFEDPNAGCSVM